MNEEHKHKLELSAEGKFYDKYDRVYKPSMKKDLRKFLHAKPGEAIWYADIYNEFGSNLEW